MSAVRQAYRFALEPAPAQERALRSHAGAARFAWNWGLAECQERYEAEGKWYSGTSLHKLWNAAGTLTGSRACTPALPASGPMLSTRPPAISRPGTKRSSPRT